MDYKALSISVAMEAQRRGAPQGVAAMLAQDVCAHIVSLPSEPDLIDVLMSIEKVMMDYGYPAR